MDFTIISQALPLLMAGTVNAVYLMVASLILSTILATGLALADIYGPALLRFLIRGYSWIARGTPPLILLFLAFYGFTAYGIRLSPMTSALIAFVTFATAYNFEILRAGFYGIPKDQFEAARALGVPLPKTLLRIVLPQLVPIIAPPYISRVTVLMKETSLASTVAVLEIMGATDGLIYSIGHPLTLITLAGLIYLLINMLLIFAEVVAERKWGHR